ncbi:hypothetical protein AA313_de0203951 [Arthrobotrys entomopaga]|nr:hypothetical protein AA313_de0203951 [Arthrobotrys entomopaga]
MGLLDHFSSTRRHERKAAKELLNAGENKAASHSTPNIAPLPDTSDPQATSHIDENKLSVSTKNAPRKSPSLSAIFGKKKTAGDEQRTDQSSEVSHNSDSDGSDYDSDSVNGPFGKRSRKNRHKKWTKSSQTYGADHTPPRVNHHIYEPNTSTPHHGRCSTDSNDSDKTAKGKSEASDPHHHDTPSYTSAVKETTSLTSGYGLYGSSDTSSGTGYDHSSSSYHSSSYSSGDTGGSTASHSSSSYNYSSSSYSSSSSHDYSSSSSYDYSSSSNDYSSSSNDYGSSGGDGGSSYDD